MVDSQVRAPGPPPSEPATSTTPDDDRPTAATKRVRAAQVLAFAALLAALVGSLGPAERVRTTYSWPPQGVAADPPSAVWYTPLLLVQHRPETISARIPCAQAPALSEAPTPVTVVATARYPERTGGLAVTRDGGSLVVQVGTERLARLGIPGGGAGEGDCSFDLRLGAGGWSIEGGPDGLARSGALEQDPVVTGLFSAVDVNAAGAPSVEVTTRAHSTRAAAHQKVAWLIAALAIAAALALVSFDRRPARPWAVAGRLGRAAVAHVHVVDAFVALALITWLVISPAFYDDGWVHARERTYASSGGFSLYYNVLATNLPLDYWLDWAHHWLAESTSTFVLLRLPALACLAAAWVLCRWIFARLQAPSGGSSVALWALGCTFVLGAMAWGMTLRPEPVTGLLVVGVMACMVRFRERQTAASVALAAALVPFALTAHPAGVVCLAPVLVTAPSLLRWAWSRLPEATAIVASSCALFTLLMFIGSDVEQRISDVQTVAPYSLIAEEWRDETARYALMSHEPYGTPVRRAAVLLILLAAAAFVLHRRRGGRDATGPAGAMLAVSLLLLVATPSKWPWHFGTLIGIAAVAVASETERLRRAMDPLRWSAWPFVVVGVAAIAGSWPWEIRASWNPADLRTLDWTPGFEASLTMSRVAVFLPLLLLAGLGSVALARRRRAELRLAPWRVASWTALIVALPAIAFTATVLVADAAKTNGWTLARQNLGGLTGEQGCGLADDLAVSVRSSARPLPAANSVQTAPLPGWVPPAPVPSVPRFALSPASRGSAETPWFRLPDDGRFGLFVAGAPARTDRLSLESGRLRAGRIVSLDTTEVTRAFDGFSGTAPWRFLAAGDLPRPDARATVVRLSARAEVAPGSALAVTGPVSYANEPLAPAMRRPGARSLVFPDLLMYFPCTRLPTLAGGLVEAPEHVLSTDKFTLFSVDESISFRGLLDLYELERRSVADSENWPEDVHLFEVDRDIPGSRLLAPDSVTFTS